MLAYRLAYTLISTYNRLKLGRLGGAAYLTCLWRGHFCSRMRSKYVCGQDLKPGLQEDCSFKLDERDTVATSASGTAVFGVIQ